MKRFIICACLSLSASAYTFGQGVMDMMKVPQTDITGTARFMAMGGAFSALGGDASAIVSNPAGLGIYRSSELIFTPNLSFNYTRTESPTHTLHDNRWNASLNNFSFVMSFINHERDRGLIANNFGVSFNRLRNFNRNSVAYIDGLPTSVSDYMAEAARGFRLVPRDRDHMFNGAVPFLVDLGWWSHMINPLDENDNNNMYYRSFLANDDLTDKRLSIQERGSLNEWTFSYAANISNRFYFGAALGIQNFNHTMITDYSEDFWNSDGYHIGYFDLDNRLETSGVGVNFKVGTIIRPLDFMRIGLAVHTPTFFSMTDTYFRTNAHFHTVGEESYLVIPGGIATYNLQTPMRVVGGLGFIIGGRAIISADYEMNDFSTMRRRTTSRMNDVVVNNDIRSQLTVSHTLRFGGELRVTDNVSLRAGYSRTTPQVDRAVEAENQFVATAGTLPHYFIPVRNEFYTAGIGFRRNSFFFDIAYVLNHRQEKLYMHNFAEPVEMRSLASSISTSFGWRF